MSEALPVIFFLHFGHSSGFKPDLVRVEIQYLLSLADDRDSLAGLTDVVTIDTVEDLGGRHHLIKADLCQKHSMTKFFQ